jgi:hypothetical protein
MLHLPQTTNDFPNLQYIDMPSLSSLLTCLGALLMLHSAYSCLHYRGILQDYDLQESISIPPIDVYIEVGAAFLSLLLGEMIGSGSLQSVDVLGNQARRPLVAPPYKTRDFDIYANRSKALSSKSS